MVVTTHFTVLLLQTPGTCGLNHEKLKTVIMVFVIDLTMLFQ